MKRVQYIPSLCTAIVPPPAVHLAHYFGALRHHIDLHHEYPGQCFFAIADYHAMPSFRDPEQLRSATHELAATYLALGLDPNKATLFRESDVPQCTELSWILATVCCPEDLKAAGPKPSEPPATPESPRTLASIATPLLTTADVLSLRATVIATPPETLAEIKRIQDVARRFNEIYRSEVFPVPEVRIFEASAVIGTDGRPMHARNNNIIAISAQLEDLWRAISEVKTAPDQKLADSPLFKLYSLFIPAAKAEELRKEDRARPEDIRRDLIIALQEFFAKFRRSHAALAKDPDFVSDVLREGMKLARNRAKVTLEDVRSAVGLDLKEL